MGVPPAAKSAFTRYGAGGSLIKKQPLDHVNGDLWPLPEMVRATGATSLHASLGTVGGLCA
jgi:hypothetical protein